MVFYLELFSTLIDQFNQCKISYVVVEMFDLKTKYDESDNVAVRMTRSITDKIGNLFGRFTTLFLFTISCCGF